MPTARPRHTITESDAIAHALAAAERRWPGESLGRGALLVRLIEEGHRAIRAEHERAVADRQAAVRRTSGALTGTYPEGYLADLRDDWPA